MKHESNYKISPAAEHLHLECSYNDEDSVYSIVEYDSDSDNYDVLELEDTVADLSILVGENSPTSKHYAETKQMENIPRRSPARYSSMYPSLRTVDSLPEVKAAVLLEKARTKQSRLRREGSIVRRNKSDQRRGGDSFYYSNRNRNNSLLFVPDQGRPYLPFPNNYDFVEDQQLPPGAYEYTPAPGSTQRNQQAYLTQNEASLRAPSYPGPEHAGGWSQQQDYTDRREDGGSLVELEIEPGVHSPLRGSKETWFAIQRGFSIEVTCFACTAPLLCIADAELVLCPDCKIVSPVIKEGGVDAKISSRGLVGGVGLGLRADGRILPGMPVLD